MGLYKENIENMSVSELVSLIDEVNKPPGWYQSIARDSNSLFYNTKSRILEVGCNTGYSGLELKRLTRAEVVGIDANGISIEKAKIRAKRKGLDVRFIF
jgi:2-polyprenyl-3-methyl-5-hydroxy-6-metoxy-1,4-benzoquinol methylase